MFGVWTRGRAARDLVLCGLVCVLYGCIQSGAGALPSPQADDETAIPPAPKIARAAPARTALPCAVQRELDAHCWSCHGEVLQFTAPMRLVSMEDFQALAPSDPSKTVAQRSRSRIHDTRRPMPPPPLAPLDAPELIALDAWLENPAPGSDPQLCAPAPSAPAPRTAAATTGAGGTSSAAAVSSDPNLKCVELRAHAVGRDTPFVVDNARDLFECFEFNAPWGVREVYGVSFKPRVDNAAVIHHWLLYQHNAPVLDRVSAPCLQLYADSSLIAAWAPGAGDLIMPDDVGTQLPPNGYTLEVHYNGSGSDQSGVEVCYTTEPRTHTAGMHWLGTTNISGTSATGVCRPMNKQPIHTLKFWPHMHLAGRRLRVTIDHADGSSELWHDALFDFHDQRLWDSDKIILPGDTITTTCMYASPSRYGETTRDEMCFDVVLAYPVGELTQPGGTGFATNQCVDGG